MNEPKFINELPVKNLWGGFDFKGDKGTARYTVEGDDMIVYCFDLNLVLQWEVRLSNAPLKVITETLIAAKKQVDWTYHASMKQIK